MIYSVFMLFKVADKRTVGRKGGTHDGSNREIQSQPEPTPWLTGPIPHEELWQPRPAPEDDWLGANVMCCISQTGVARSRFRAGVQAILLATSSATSSRSSCPLESTITVRWDGPLLVDEQVEEHRRSNAGLARPRWIELGEVVDHFVAVREVRACVYATNVGRSARTCCDSLMGGARS